MTAARLLSQSLFCGLMAVAGSGCGIYASMPMEGSFDRTLAVNGPVDLEIRSGSGALRIMLVRSIPSMWSRASAPIHGSAATSNRACGGSRRTPQSNRTATRF